MKDVLNIISLIIQDYIGMHNESYKPWLMIISFQVYTSSLGSIQRLQQSFLERQKSTASGVHDVASLHRDQA